MEIFNPQKGLFYYQTVNNDTLYWFDMTDKSYTKFKSLKNEPTNRKFLNRSCEKITLEKTYILPGFSFPGKDIYYHSGLIQINPKWFKKWKYSNFNKIAKEMDGFFLRFENITPDN